MNTASNRAAIFYNFMDLDSGELDKLVAEAIDLPGASEVKNLEYYFSPTSRKEDWDIIERYTELHQIKLGSTIHRDEGYAWLVLPGETGINSYLGGISTRWPRDRAYLVEKLLNAVGLPEKWTSTLEAFNEKVLLRGKGAALLTAVKLLKEKAAEEVTVQGELVAVKPAEYFLEAVYRLPGDIYRTIMCEKKEGTQARERETVLPKFKDFQIKKPA